MTNLKQNWDDDARFDRLVDGELSPSEYRELIAALDDEPGGWRRCALAFLEAQALAKDLGVLRKEDFASKQHGAVEESVQAVSTVQPPLIARQLGWFVVLAASVCIAFFAGRQLANTAGITNPLNSQVVKKEGQHHENAVVSDSQHSNATPSDDESPDEASDLPVGNLAMKVPVGDNGEVQYVSLPVYDLNRTDPSRIWNVQSPISDSVLKQLQAAGKQVQIEHGFLPVDSPAGRRLVIPTDRARVMTVSY